MAHVRKSLEGDIAYLSTRLRDADLRELEAHGIVAETALRQGFEGSSPCYTIEHDGEPVAMFGATPLPFYEDVGLVWLLGSDQIMDIRTRFLRESRKWLSEIGGDFTMLCNVVHEDNHLHHRWLKFLGFTFLRHHPPFIEFARFCNV